MEFLKKLDGFGFVIGRSILGIYFAGFGSSKRLQIDISTLEIVKAGLQLSFNISKQIPPLLLIFGW